MTVVGQAINMGYHTFALRLTGRGAAYWAHPVRQEDREQIELLQIDHGEIRVAEYLVEPPPREMLEAKLHEAIRMARGQTLD